MKKDLDESDNRIGDFPEKTKELKSLLDNWETEMNNYEQRTK